MLYTFWDMIFCVIVCCVNTLYKLELTEHRTSVKLQQHLQVNLNKALLICTTVMNNTLQNGLTDMVIELTKNNNYN